jgi:phosphotransferase system  glucose/maltose/N-acetylglucosamine-specific IIC component
MSQVKTESASQQKVVKAKKEKQPGQVSGAKQFWGKVLVKLQMLGKALLYPIAVLPFAALLNRFGSLAMELNPGCLTAYIYNKFKNIKLPMALSFFGGRRFIPMMMMVISFPVASNYVNQDGTIKNLPEFVNYLNQIVDNQGLHLSHFQNVDGKILTDGNEWTDYFVINWDKISSSNNTIIMGDPQAATAYVFGDINAFQKSLISGNFQTGYFPMYWGGLTAACAAMILAAPKGKRKKTATFLGGIAVVAALTGIDEPVVFSFIFVGPILWVYNAVFTAKTFRTRRITNHYWNRRWSCSGRSPRHHT